MQAKKGHLRREISSRLAALKPEERRKEQEALTAGVLNLPEWVSARAVLAYLPLPGEFDPRPLLAAALEGGKTIALPRLSRNGGMNFRRVENLEGPFQRHRYGMDEPPESALPWEPSPAGRKHTLLLLPGLAFDLRGYRLGRGGGFYDAYIARYPGSFTLVATPFRCQILPSIPRESHDLRVDKIVLPP